MKKGFQSTWRNAVPNSHVVKPLKIPSMSFLAVVPYVEDISRFWLVPYNSIKHLDNMNDAMAKIYYNFNSI